MKTVIALALATCIFAAPAGAHIPQKCQLDASATQMFNEDRLSALNAVNAAISANEYVMAIELLGPYFEAERMFSSTLTGLINCIAKN